MKEIAVYDAKTRLSELLVAVNQGEQFTITRRGVAVAKLVAADSSATTRTAAQQQRTRVRRALSDLRQERRGVALDLPLRGAIESGRD